MTIQIVKDNLSAMLHGGSLNKVRNVYNLFERAANTMLAKIDPLDTIRNVGLSTTVWDDVYNYALPSDFKKPIDLIPQSNRQMSDDVTRLYAGRFDFRKALDNKKISIEGSGGDKTIRINWKSRQPKTLNTMDSLTANGTWSASGTSANVVLDTITKYSGAGSIRFDLVASGDGIQNNDMTKVDLTDEDEIGDVFVRFYIKDSTDLAKVTSVSVIWGNTLTTALWTGVAQTAQADGTAFKVGWNLIKVPWSTATETGTVDETVVDAVKVTFATTGAISDIRIDIITVAIGRAFDIKYYSKYIFNNTSGTWISIPTTNDDSIILDNDATQIYLLECLVAAAHQIEGKDSIFDIDFAKKQLYGDKTSSIPAERVGLYQKYKAENPSMSKKAITYYTGLPARGRW